MPVFHSKYIAGTGHAVQLPLIYRSEQSQLLYIFLVKIKYISRQNIIVYYSTVMMTSSQGFLQAKKAEAIKKNPLLTSNE